MNPLDVQCASCQAPPGQPCIHPMSQNKTAHHPARLRLARADSPCPTCAADFTISCQDRQGKPQTRLHAARSSAHRATA